MEIEYYSANKDPKTYEFFFFLLLFKSSILKKKKKTPPITGKPIGDQKTKKEIGMSNSAFISR